MSNGQDPNNPYPQYAVPGQGAVHGAHAPHPGQPPAAAPQSAPPGWTQDANGQWVQVATPMAAPPSVAPNPYPSGPPAAAPTPAAEPWQGTAGFDQLPPELKAQLEAEMAASQGSGIDFDSIKYYTPKKPTTVGQTTESVIRLLPGWQGERSPYWHKEWRHFCTVQLDDGRKMRLPRLCPSKNTPPGQQPRPCPICERQERAQASGDKAMSTNLRPRSRFYINVIDAENQDDHFVTDSKTGQTICRSMVWGVGAGLFRKLGNIIGARGPIYDVQTGRYLKVWCTKTGPEDRDVRYDIIDGSDACPIPAGFEQIQLTPLDKLDIEKDYATMAKEIASTYPDAAGVMTAPPMAAPPAAAPPYASPYQPPVNPPGYGQGPGFSVQTTGGQPPGQPQPPVQPTQPQPPMHAAPPQPAAPAPAQPPAAAPQAAPPGWAQLPNGQWVQVATTPTPGGDDNIPF